MSRLVKPVLIQAADGATVQMQVERAGSWTRVKRAEFLGALAMTANVKASAAAAGMSEQGAYQLRQRCAVFRADWQRALCEGYARLELMMLERATFGSDKPQWYGGKEVGRMHEVSDRLGLSLLAQHRAAARETDKLVVTVDLEAVQARVRMRFETIGKRLAAQNNEPG